ncbi:MAG TPA: RsbRD N-terminal domain-containing protein [Verrucomicrobiae bacterium]|nr:RsbRD N-terminal domain-containing protein [Verrucomicrobiae bacterium]
MLLRLLTQHRDEIVERCRAKAAGRTDPLATPSELQHGIPIFINQLIEMLAEGRRRADEARRDTNNTAALHGREMLQHGFTIDQVVHDYGDLCQAVSDVALEKKISFEVDEFRWLNRCLDDVIAEAVAAFAAQRDFAAPDQTGDLNDRVLATAVELQSLVHTATLAVTALRAGRVGVGGATGTLLERTMLGIGILLERTIKEYRATSGQTVRH